MLRINDREVELNSLEMEARDYFDELLAKGHNIPEAVETVQDLYLTTLSEEFYDYLKM